MYAKLGVSTSQQAKVFIYNKSEKMGAIGSIMGSRKSNEDLIAFSAAEFRSFKIKSIRVLSSNTKLYVLELQSKFHHTVT